VQQKVGEDASAACREALDLYRAKGDVVSTTLLESRTNGVAGACARASVRSREVRPDQWPMIFPFSVRYAVT
jgi:hypothetical protein